MEEKGEFHSKTSKSKEEGHVSKEKGLGSKVSYTGVDELRSLCRNVLTA